MTASTRALPRGLTVADLLERLGGIPGDRVRLDPLPGKATEKDVLRVQKQEDRLYELVDGTLVEKAMGVLESSLALILGKLLGLFLDRHDLGFLTGADGTFGLMPGLVRIPDLAFTAWSR